MPVKWEYTFYQRKGTDRLKDLVEHFDDLGSQGYLMIFVYENVYWFRRPKHGDD